MSDEIEPKYERGGRAPGRDPTIAEALALAEAGCDEAAGRMLDAVAAPPDDVQAARAWMSVTAGRPAAPAGALAGLRPVDPDARLALARSLLALGAFRSAIEVVAPLTAGGARAAASAGAAHAVIGNALRALGQPGEAERILRGAMRDDPAAPEPRLGLAGLLAGTSRPDRALDQCRAALVLAPAGSRLIRLAAGYFRHLGKSAEAALASRWLVSVAPADGKARILHAIALLEAGFPLGAASAAGVAMQLPGYGDEAAGMVCAALLRAGRPEVALRAAQDWAAGAGPRSPAKLLAVLRRHVGDKVFESFGMSLAASLDAGDGLLEELGNELLAHGEFDGFSVALERSLTGDDTDLRRIAKLVDAGLRVCDFDAVDGWTDRLRSFLETRLDGMTTLRGVMHTAYLAPFIDLEPAHRRRISDAIARLQPPAPRAPATARSSDRIRVGYASPHFGDHPIGHATCGLFEHHDRSAVEVFAFSLADRSADPSDHAAKIRNGVDHFVPLEAASDDEAAAVIRRCGIDVLVDLNGFMTPNRLGVFARRPAPVQCYWLGHGGGLGVGSHDFVIADRTVIPDEHLADFRERVVRLPDVFAPADRPAIASAAGSRADYGLAETGAVLCGFNNPQKLGRRTVEVWLRILQAVPDSQLWLTGGGLKTALAPRLRCHAEAAGIDGRRLVFAERVVDKSVHLGRHRLADLFLDSLHHNAATTALDALWAGLPILTVQGSTFLSRVGASMLHAVGMDDMVCRDADEFVDRAAALLADRSRLLAVRRRLAAGLDSAPLFDIPLCARHLETAFRRMLAADPQDRSPIDVEPDRLS